jgi:hypothetical protein
VRRLPYDLGQDDARHPFARIFAVAELASMMEPGALPELRR